MSSRAEPIPEAAKVKRPRIALHGRNRTKLSTTVAAENFAFLETMVSTGRTESIAEAVDLAIARLRRMENRSRLERATTEYFDGLTPEAQVDEQALAHLLYKSAGSVDIDLEP